MSNIKIHKDHKELSARLQAEVNTILEKVEKKDQQGLFAEFREHEVVEISGSDDKPIITEAIDERIMIRLSQQQTPLLHRTEVASKKLGKKVHGAVNYLFKPFEI